MGITKQLPLSTVRRRSARRTRLRKLSSKLRKALRRLPSVGKAVVVSPRRLRNPRRSRSHATSDTGDLTVSVGGASSRNFVFAARSVHFHGSLAPVIGVTLVVLAVATGFGAYSMNASKSAVSHPPNLLARGQPFTLDVAIAPFRSASVAAPNATRTEATSAAQGCKAIADALSNQLADDAKTRFEKQFGNLEVAVWRPDQLDASLLKDDDLLTVSKKLATAQQLDLVVIGTVACDGNRVVVTPSVAVSPDLEEQTAELNTIRDMSALSSPIVWNSNGGMMSALSEQLAARIDLAVRLSQSLERYSRGISGDYLSAASIAEALLPKFSEWPSDKAALHLLAGNAYMGASTDDCGALQPDLLNRAESQFGLALKDEPEMANAYLALGALMGYRADTLQTDQVDERQILLNKGEDFYQHALTAKDVSDPRLMELQVALGRGRNKLIEFDARHQPELLDAAGLILQRAESAANMPALQARALALRAGINLAQRNMTDALSLFGQAQSLTKDRKLHTDVALAMAQIQTTQGDVCSAAVQYRLASQTLCVADHLDYARQAQDLQLSCKIENDLRQTVGR